MASKHLLWLWTISLTMKKKTWVYHFTHQNHLNRQGNKFHALIMEQENYSALQRNSMLTLQTQDYLNKILMAESKYLIVLLL